MSYFAIRKIFFLVTFVSLIVSIVYISYLLISPPDPYTNPDNIDEQRRKSSIRDNLATIAFIGFLLAISILIVYLVLNRKGLLEMPIVENNAVDRVFLSSIVFIIISPMSILVIMYIFTIVMNLLFY